MHARDKSNNFFQFLSELKLIFSFTTLSVNMLSKSFFILLVMLVDVSLSADQQIDVDRKKMESKVLSRRKRFLIFPTGSSFSVAACMTVGVYGNPQFSLFSWAVNYGFAYNLPTNSTIYSNPPANLFDVPFFDNDLGKPEEAVAAPVTTPREVEAETLPADHDAPSGGDSSQDAAASRRQSSRQYHVYYQPSYETKPMIQRRYRREIYRNIESVIDK